MVNFGLITYPPLPRDGRVSRVELFQQTVREAQTAENAGFTSFWVGEHHFHEHFAAIPHPLMFCAYAAAHTTTLRLGTAAILPALHNPVRLAEDIAFADVLSNGRIEIGIGGGYSVEEFQGLGVPYGKRRELAWSVVDRLLMALCEHRVPIERPGAIAADVTVYPFSVQQPHPPISYCGYHRDSMLESLRRNLGFVFDPVCSLEKIVQKVAQYRELHAEIHDGASPQRVIICRPFFIHEDRERARQLGYQAHQVYLDEFRRLAARENWVQSDPGRTVDPDQMDVGDSFEDWTEKVALVGTPADIIDRLAGLRRATGLTDLLLWYHPTPHETIKTAIRLFGRTVIPHFAG